jgi:hypothetical protein
VTDQPQPRAQPPPQPPPANGARLGMVERLAAIANRMTIANAVTIGILAAVFVPVYGAWRFLTDATLREDFFNMAKERHDLAPGCIVYETRVSSVRRYHVAALVLPGPDGNDYLVGARMHGASTPQQMTESCERLHRLADHLREKVPDVDERFTTGGAAP